MAEFAIHMPDLHEGLTRIASSLGTAGAVDTLAQVFPTLPQQTIDYGIMEQAENVAVLPVDIGWTDIGSWATLLDVLDADAEGNVVRGPGITITPDTKNTLIYTSKRLVATLGIEDLIIVDTGDALLVCPRQRAQDIRKIVDELRRSEYDSYLIDPAS